MSSILSLKKDKKIELFLQIGAVGKKRADGKEGKGKQILYFRIIFIFKAADDF